MSIPQIFIMCVHFSYQLLVCLFVCYNFFLFTISFTCLNLLYLYYYSHYRKMVSIITFSTDPSVCRTLPFLVPSVAETTYCSTFFFLVPRRTAAPRSCWWLADTSRLFCVWCHNLSFVLRTCIVFVLRSLISAVLWYSTAAFSEIFTSLSSLLWILLSRIPHMIRFLIKLCLADPRIHTWTPLFAIP